MDEILMGALIGIGIATVCYLMIFGDDLNTYYKYDNLIVACEKDLPRSSNCVLYAKEKK